MSKFKKEKRGQTMKKRLSLMIRRNILRVPYMLLRMILFAENDKVSVEKKFDLIREIGERGCKSGNVNIHGYGIENFPKESGYIMYPNHQGLFDVMGLVYLDPAPFGVIIKKETEDIYLLRKLIHLMGGMFMDRNDVKQGLTVINAVADEVKNGRNFLIFPEGTRSKNGNKLGDFKGGSFKAATKAKCPIVPIAIIDSYLPFDISSTKPVDVQLHILPPITYEEYKGMKTAEIADIVKERIEQVIAENENNFSNEALKNA